MVNVGEIGDEGRRYVADLQQAAAQLELLRTDEVSVAHAAVAGALGRSHVGYAAVAESLSEIAASARVLLGEGADAEVVCEYTDRAAQGASRLPVLQAAAATALAGALDALLTLHLAVGDAAKDTERAADFVRAYLRTRDM